MIEDVKKLAYKLLENETSGHDAEHIQRVLDLSLKFADQEQADSEIVALAALLHDVDDYKIFGKKNAEELSNAIKILADAKVNDDVKQKVLTIIKTMGYSKCLKGIRPTTIEGKVVSDADMCDASGANGILRIHAYGLSHGKSFFDHNIWPVINESVEGYTKKAAVGTPGVCHIFEKILKLKNLMLTASGKQEATKRHEIVIVEFLRNLFEEENTPNWLEYLDKYNP